MDASSPDNQLIWLEVVSVNVEEFLLTWPLTYLKQTKYGRTFANNKTKYEYQQCRCECGYKLTLPLAEDENISFKESAIPEKHYDPEESPDNIRTDTRTTEIIERLLWAKAFII